MKTKIIEGSNGFNWGKFLVARFTDEWDYKSKIDGLPLLRTRGWTPDNLWVMDLQTGEGALFRPGGFAVADLEKHKVWVCPLFEGFLTWLYKQDLSDLDKLPDVVDDLPKELSALWGHRRSGPSST